MHLACSDLLMIYHLLVQ